MFVRLTKLFLLVLLSFSLDGCARKRIEGQSFGTTRNFKDGLGREISVVFPPKRIVSLAPSVTEMLFALGVDDRIVGVTSYCDYPAAARQKQQVGDTLHLSLERIISLRPDLVVISTASQLESLTRRLDELSIPVFVTDPRTVRDVALTIRGLGELTGSEARAAALVSAFDRKVSEVELRVGQLPRPRVLYVLQTAPLITVGKNTFINDLINLAGGSSISATETADYPQFSRETVAARKPEVIIAPASHGTELVTEESLLHDFATTPAVIRRRIFRVDPDLVDRPGPRIVEGLEQLARGLHPAATK